jgi:hypothetical protein
MSAESRTLKPVAYFTVTSSNESVPDFDCLSPCEEQAQSSTNTAINPKNFFILLFI